MDVKAVDTRRFIGQCVLYTWHKISAFLCATSLCKLIKNQAAEAYALLEERNSDIEGPDKTRAYFDRGPALVMQGSKVEVVYNVLFTLRYRDGVHVPDLEVDTLEAQLDWYPNPEKHFPFFCRRVYDVFEDKVREPISRSSSHRNGPSSSALLRYIGRELKRTES